MPLQVDLTIERGDYQPLVFAGITNLPSSGLAAYGVIQFTAKRDLTDADAAALIRHSLADGGVVVTTNGNTTTPGVLTVGIQATDTSVLASHETRLRYDVQVIDETQTPPRPYTIAEGNLTVSADVTQAVT